MNFLNGKLFLASTLVLLAACGSDGDKVDSGSTNRSAHSSEPSGVGGYASVAEAMEPCRELRISIAGELVMEDYLVSLTDMADGGEVCAQYGLGALYRLGYDTIPGDEALARHYLQLAAKQGHPDAKYELSFM